jgi:hypothetical protein
MAVRRNGYYQPDPALAASFDNLADVFKTPSGSDLLGYTKSAAEREKAARLADLYNYAKSAEYDQTRADRMGVAAGQYARTPPRSRLPTRTTPARSPGSSRCRSLSATAKRSGCRRRRPPPRACRICSAATSPPTKARRSRRRAAK